MASRQFTSSLLRSPSGLLSCRAAQLPRPQLLQLLRLQQQQQQQSQLTIRFLRRTITTAAPTSTPPATAPSFLRRALKASFGALLFTTLGFAIAVTPSAMALAEISASVPTAEATLALYQPPDAVTEAIDAALLSHPYTRALLADPTFSASRPHLRIPASHRPRNLTAGTLQGPGLLTVPPLGFIDDGRVYIQLQHVGTDLCGHPGIVHGGMVATLMDEGLARATFGALPHGIGVTASLTVNYRQPCPADAFLVLRAKTTKVEGRKAWVKGSLEVLGAGQDGRGEGWMVLAEAEALFVSPRQAAVSFFMRVV